jgi:chromosome partitioning protein
MHVLVLASQKGGSGKTTLSGHLAVEAMLAGVGPVALIDTDPQGSLAEWWNARSAPEPHFAKVGLLQLSDALHQLDEAGIRLAVIDTPPAITESISHVIAHADLVVVPTRPSPHDLRAVGATVDLAERHGKTVLFVVNAATPRARITGEAAVALSQHGTVAPVTVHHRVDFAASMIDGRTVGEVAARSSSAKEVRELWTYIQSRLARLTQDASITPVKVPTTFAIHGLSPLETTSSRTFDTHGSELEVADTAPGAISEISAESEPPAISEPMAPFDGRRERARASETPAGLGHRRAQPFGRRSPENPF